MSDSHEKAIGSGYSDVAGLTSAYASGDAAGLSVMLERMTKDEMTVALICMLDLASSHECRSKGGRR